MLTGLFAKPWQAVYAQIDLKKARIYIRDGSSTPNEIEITVGEGNLTYSEKKNREYILDRGALDDVRDGDEVPVEVSFEFKWEYIRGPINSSDAPPSVEDVLKQIGTAADWVSTDSDACRPYAVDIVVIYTPTPATCGDKETIVLADFRYEDLPHDLRAGTISCSGKCNITAATATREAQSA